MCGISSFMVAEHIIYYLLLLVLVILASKLKCRGRQQAQAFVVDRKSGPSGRAEAIKYNKVL